MSFYAPARSLRVKTHALEIYFTKKGEKLHKAFASK